MVTQLKRDCALFSFSPLYFASSYGVIFIDFKYGERNVKI